MIISNKKKFIYFAVGKTGTTSIESYLNQLHDDKKINKHARPESVGTEKLSEYFTFCFVRNPWDRLISMYKQFQKPNNLHLAIRKKHYTISNKYKFIDYVKKLDEKFFQDHKQNRYYLHNGTPLRFIGRFENLQEDFDTVCDLIKIKRGNLKYKNKSVHQSRRKHYSEDYDDETRRIVAEGWAEDIEYFNYKFGKE